jgi:hypothetical protein
MMARLERAWKGKILAWRWRLPRVVAEFSGGAALQDDNVAAARFCDGVAMDFAFALLGTFADG